MSPDVNSVPSNVSLEVHAVATSADAATTLRTKLRTNENLLPFLWRKFRSPYTVTLLSTITNTKSNVRYNRE